ncbi:DNA polymerase III subunit chi [Glaciecola sp. 1036]|uniref:DNA polymerase III subunit chi n=1 Tax=Alteromonadaceae TaxID=72275 RepID=UPI003D06A781
MTKVVFYQLEDASSQDYVDIAVQLVAKAYNGKSYLTVVCTDDTQAETIDETLWEKPADQFIAHNLYGEGDDKPAPVEILTLDKLKSGTRIRNKRLVINLSFEYLDNFQSLGEIFDFVPVDEEQKSAARKRYASYKQAGCEMVFEKLSA